jgi:hypothetical protein
MYSQVALRYLAEQMRTPTTVFDAASCLVLPNPANDAAVYLVEPGDALALTLLQAFVRVALVDQPPHLGTAPYQLFLAESPVSGADSTSTQQFANNLQLLPAHTSIIQDGSSHLLVTRWSFLRSAPVVYRTFYTYRITASFSPNSAGAASSPVYSDCMFSSMQAGDQLIVTFPLHEPVPASSQVALTGEYYLTQPHNIAIGPLQLENIRNRRTVPIQLYNAGGGNTLILNMP